MEEMKRRVMYARHRVVTVEHEYLKLKKEYDDAIIELKKATKELEDYDYQQSQIDGRTTKIPKGQKAKVAVKDLTLDQIKSIANRLGVSLDLKEAQNEEGT